MSILNGSYELSLWEDKLTSTGIEEERLMVIGSDRMDNQAKAIEPRFTVNVNGSRTLSFKMYYRYIDNITGEEVENIFTKHITNESKLKLKHKDKWYDLIVKSISENSADYSFTYSAIDYHINELSKNGFGLTLDTSLENNIGTVSELGNRILQDTGWSVSSEPIPQLLEEPLVEITFSGISTIPNVYQIIDSTGPSSQITENMVDDGLVIAENEKIYVFYSCLKDESERLQFIYGSNLTKDQNRVITTKDTQYYIDNVTYAINSNYSNYGLKKPVLPFMDNTEDIIAISNNYRGKRYVFSRRVIYNSVLDKYVTEYFEGSGTSCNTWHVYTEDEYEAPILIQNYTTNCDFKNTLGWTSQYLSTKNSTTEGATYPNKQNEYGVKIEAKTSPDIEQALLTGSYNPETNYTPYLEANFQDTGTEHPSVLINSGIYDNRTKIKNFSPGQTFVLFYKLKTGGEYKTGFTAKVGIRKYLTGDNCYLSNDSSNRDFLIFDSQHATPYTVSSGTNPYPGYNYITATVNSGYSLTETQFQGSYIYTFIAAKEVGKIGIEDFQIFPYVYKSQTSTGFMLPADAPTEANITTKYYYFNPNLTTNTNATRPSEMRIIERNSPMPGLQNSYITGAEKTITVSVKQSNYFNAIQSLCETAECWADFDVTHDSQGKITSKTVRFKNYIGQNNYAGFRYGVNLKQITRQLNSNSIVTKLIVPDNTNEYAKNGFCSIARAGSNTTGENYIYDFSYYYNKNLLNRNEFHDILYVTEGSSSSNCQGYFSRLSSLNQQIDSKNEAIAVQSIPLLEAQSNLKTYENGRIAAEESYRVAAADFLKAAGFEYKNIMVNGDEAETKRRQDAVNGNDTIKDYFHQIITYEQSARDFSIKEAQARISLTAYEAANRQLTEERDNLLEQKERLNLIFYQTFSRFIQEGTWKDDAAIDDEKYYINAQSVAYTSAKPQVTYSINVMELDGLPGYENLSFQLADKTWIEDEEFFGFDENNQPIREEIVITEITYNLDDKSQTSIKVQNFKNQFQDLFQRITAQVQQTSYSSGVWENAANFVQSTPTEQSQFLQEALNSAELMIQNAGNQSVISDINGITVTDLTTPSQQVRITGGAILLSDVNAGGQQFWKVGLTAQGINAQTITTGSLNTGSVQIMSGTEPYFRWDAFGITAYDFTLKNEGGIESKRDYNSRKGVRFDRFGIYGFNNKDGASWHPKELKEIQDNALFALTWDGLFIKLGNATYKTDSGTEIEHTSTAAIGKVDDIIYNSWNEAGLPIYDVEKAATASTFVKIFSAGIGADTTDKNENLVIYDDGTLVANNIKLTGGIQWTEASSPSKSVYATTEYVQAIIKQEGSIDKARPANNTAYSTFPDSDTETTKGWHKISTVDDAYYVHTDNGGATWQGPFLITGKSISSTEIKYTTAIAGTDPTTLTNESAWRSDRPSLEDTLIGHNIYTRMVDIFNNGTRSSARYTIDGGRTASIQLSREASSIPAAPDGQVDRALLKNLSKISVVVKDGNEDVTLQEGLQFIWSAVGGVIKQTDTSESEVDTETTEVCLVVMESNSATITVNVKSGDMDIGTKTFTISKSIQGADSILCYISSSKGTAFETNESGNTILTAHLLRAGIELDPSGDAFDYTWYYEENEQEDQTFGTGKSIECSIANLKNKRVYFMATEKTNEDAELA